MDNGSTKARCIADNFRTFMSEADNQVDVYIHHDINAISRHFVISKETRIFIYQYTTVKRQRYILKEKKIKYHLSNRIRIATKDLEYIKRKELETMFLN